TKKCGTVVQLCVVRSAIKRPRVVGTSRLTVCAVRSARLEAAGAAAACTSDARISPPGPVPRTVAISIPSSFARRRAFGEILALCVGDGSETPAAAGTGAAVLLCDPARAVCALAADSFSAGGFSPGATIQAIVLPT